MSEVQVGEVPSAVAANVEIKLSANTAPLVTISRSVEEAHWVKLVPKAHPITPMPNNKPDHKLDVVAGCSV